NRPAPAAFWIRKAVVELVRLLVARLPIPDRISLVSDPPLPGPKLRSPFPVIARRLWLSPLTRMLNKVGALAEALSAICSFVVSALKSVVVPAAFWIWKAVVESAVFLNLYEGETKFILVVLCRLPSLKVVEPAPVTTPPKK